MMMDNKIILQNSNNYKNYLDFENVLEIEMIFEKIKTKIAEVIYNFLKYWNAIDQEKILESDLLRLDNKIQSGILECEKMWQNQHEIHYLSKKPQWEFLYIWYKRYVLNQKMKGQTIDYQISNNLQQNFCDEDSDSDSDYENHYRQAFDPKKLFYSMIATKENGTIVKCMNILDRSLDYKDSVILIRLLLIL
ncbi:unnamed protein product (macronuclear) [Paramecium tetraurelia]|uniref:Uncharacterized protein n=1 Tax=Paramecium tetraurelia TaxID=5888 RepID=A0D3C1_PARTE|nr:uncharacterized protein GSPATT00013023001 [Paramecium tetraurelia]CAK77538.1 unnamed protein product [Paramecium tetraurelia]|eukprot:XP_001444935.1 hypothetical protein (macronuclear) [Paramecium tetraurelia strain d4-2]